MLRVTASPSPILILGAEVSRIQLASFIDSEPHPLNNLPHPSSLFSDSGLQAPLGSWQALLPLSYSSAPLRDGFQLVSRFPPCPVPPVTYRGPYCGYDPETYLLVL